MKTLVLILTCLTVAPVAALAAAQSPVSGPSILSGTDQCQGDPTLCTQLDRSKSNR